MSRVDVFFDANKTYYYVYFNNPTHDEQRAQAYLLERCPAVEALEYDGQLSLVGLATAIEKYQREGALPYTLSPISRTKSAILAVDSICCGREGWRWLDYNVG